MRNISRGIFFLFILFSCKSEYNIESSKNSYLDVNVEPDSISLKMIRPYKEIIDSKMNEIICFNKVDMHKGNPESLLGNFVADLCVQKTFTYNHIDFCLLNSGGLRSSLHAGNITLGDIYKLMPFDNKMVIVKLLKNDIIEIFKYIQKKGGDPISKLRIEIKNEEIINHNLNFKKDTFYVLTSDYLAGGGDDMNFFIDKEVNNLNLMLRDLIIDHCKDKDSITSSLDNRIFIHE